MGHHFMLLPCGCVVEAVPERARQDAVECCWCGASFARADLGAWVEANSNQHLWSYEVRPLVQLGGVLLEVLEVCDCGAPVVRPRGARGEQFHLGDDSAEAAEFLSN